MKKCIILASFFSIVACDKKDDSSNKNNDLYDRKTTKIIAENILENYFVHEKSYNPKNDLNLLDVNSSNEDFYNNVTNIFNKLKDRHTVYNNPILSRHLFGFHPKNLSFQLVSDNGHVNKIVVAKVDLNENSTVIKNKDYFDSLKDFQVGDTIVSINGKSALQALKDTYDISKGANIDAQKSYGLEYLLFRFSPFPKILGFEKLEIEVLRNKVPKKITISSTEIQLIQHAVSSKKSEDLTTPKEIKIDPNLYLNTSKIDPFAIDITCISLDSI